MKQIRFGRAPLLAALVAVFGACHDADRVNPLSPEGPSAFAKGGSKPATGGGGGGGGGGTTQKIAFFKGGTDGRIYTVAPDGSGLTAIPSTEGGMDPAWSPDRTKLAFTIAWGAQAGLYVIDASGSNRVRLYGGPAASPSWSPDGSRIAFQATVANKPQILVIRRDGTNLVQATAVGTNYSPSWSPDGTRLAYFGSRPEGTGIWVVAEQGGQRQLIVSCWDCRSPRWSPVKGDKRIIYTTRFAVNGREHSAINIVDFDGSNRKTFLASDRHLTTDLRPSWSPDAKQIVFTSLMLTGFSNFVIANADGSNPRVVTLPLEFGGYAPAWGR